MTNDQLQLTTCKIFTLRLPGTLRPLVLYSRLDLPTLNNTGDFITLLPLRSDQIRTEILQRNCSQLTGLEVVAVDEPGWSWLLTVNEGN